MAKINYLHYQSYGNSVDANQLGLLLIVFCGLVCTVFAILGIKFRWFKHRLNFESSSNAPSSSFSSASTAATNNNAIKPDMFRSIGTEFNPTPFEVGVFRKRADDEFDVIERPKELPPVRIKSSAVKLPKPQPNRTANQSGESNHTSKSHKSHRSDKKSPLSGNRTAETTHNKRVRPATNSADQQQTDQNRSKTKSRSNRDQSQKTTSNQIQSDFGHLESQKPLLKAPTHQNLTTSSSSNQQSMDIKSKAKAKAKKKITFENVPDDKTADESVGHMHRRPTGFAKLSREQLEELESLSEAAGEASEDKPMHRRPTGFELLSPEELQELEDLANEEENNAIEKKFSAIRFHSIEEDRGVDNEDIYGYVSNTKSNNDADNHLDSHPGVVQQQNGKLVFKITGFSDNEDDDEELQMYSHMPKDKASDTVEKNSVSDNQISLLTARPEPQPRTSLGQTKESDDPSQTEPLSSYRMGSKQESKNTSEGNHKVEEEEDSWSAVRNYRNLTEEMVKHNQAIRDAAKEKAARRELRNPLAYDDMQTSNQNGRPESRPKSMKDVKRKQHENEEKKSSQKVNLNQDDDGDSEISC